MTDDSAEVRRFAEELTRIQRSLYAYICTLIGSSDDAQDVLQGTNCEIWERYEEFQPGTSLAAWAYKIAYYRVLTLRKQTNRRSQRFQDATMELLADRMAERSDEFELRSRALIHCLQRLNEPDRELICQRYLEGVNVEKLAESLGRSAKSLYRSLARIRGLLLDCVQSRLNAEGLE